MHPFVRFIYRHRVLSIWFQHTILQLFKLERIAWYLYYRGKGVFDTGSNNRIPKLIHLCWFSNNPYPASVLKCLHTWYRYLPDYRIIVWNRQKALALNIPYVDEALNAGQYAFAADVVRLYALLECGGIYMDSDICLRGRFDSYLSHDVVFFREIYPDRVLEESRIQNLRFEDRWGSEIQAAFFASVRGAAILDEILDFYRTHHFVREDGSLLNDIVSPQVFARTLEKHGMILDDVEQILPNDIAVFVNGLVARNRNSVIDKSFAIHCCAQSWKKLQC